MRFFSVLIAALCLASASAGAAPTWNVTVTTRLPNGAAAGHAFVRMYQLRSDYTINSLQTKNADASGVAVFKAHSGVCFKGEDGSDASGRPLHVGGACLKGHEKTLTITLD